MNKKLLQRMLDLADIKPVIKEGKMNLSNFELVKESVNGNTYAIVREKNRYYVKSTQTKQNLNESNFDYLGGLGNKTKNSFSSYEEATRYLNLMFEEINNHYEGVGNVNLLESDLINEKKFVLKLNKKKSEPKAEEPATDFGGASDGGEFDFGGGEDTEGGEFDFGGGEDTEGGEFNFGGEDTEGEDTEGEEFDFGGEETEEGGDEFDFGGETEEEGDEDLDFEDSDDEIKDIQSTTGKLGQQLRDVEDLSSDMQKWVAKSVLSALNLDNMDTEDKKDIIRTVKKKTEEEPEEESFDFGGEEPVEETYDSYMEDDEDPYLMTRKDLGESDDVSYTFYMKDEPKFSERELEDWLYDMESAGFGSTPVYDSYMEDNKYRREDNPNIGGDEDLDTNKLLFDNEGTHNPNYRMRRGVDNSMNNTNFVRNYDMNMDYDDFEMSPQRQKEPDTTPSEPTTKPGTPDKTPDKDRPSRRPFNPPPHITPGEEPGPKAGTKRRGFMEEDYMEPMMFPAPAKEPDTTPSEPTTKPGTPDKTPDKDRPSRRPFNPPPHITPGEEPGPKAGYDDDVVFE
jgi:hypothetical protein